MPPIALTIAGSDPGGGAGIQADLKTFHRFGVYGLSAITLITVQNSRGVSRVQTLDAGLVREQIAAVLEDFPPAAVKTGAMGSPEVVEAVAAFDFPGPLIVDPVTVSSHGTGLGDRTVLIAIRELLLPRAALVTPNLGEAAELSGVPVEDIAGMKEAARRIAGTGVAAVLVKGGHLAGEPVDILWSGGVFTEWRGTRVVSKHTHGTGCTLSAAIAALLAKGWPLERAVGGARDFVAEAIRTAPGLGGGAGPLNHWAGLLDPV